MSRILYTNDFSEHSDHAESTVVKQTKYGTFYSTVSCQECDEDIKNRWDGYYFAEIKCDMKSEKMKIRLMKERKKEVQHLLNVAKNSGKSDETVNFLTRQLQVIEHEISGLEESYKNKKKRYPQFVRESLQKRRDFRMKTKN